MRKITFYEFELPYSFWDETMDNPTNFHDFFLMPTKYSTRHSQIPL